MKIVYNTLIFLCVITLLLLVLVQSKEIKRLEFIDEDRIESLDTIQIEMDSLKMRIKDLLNTIDSIPAPIEVKATMYHPVEAQCDSDPLITADGSKICPINVSDWN